MSDYKLSHLQELEAESIHIIREVAAEFENPVMLYSIGKDSSVMVRLAEKAFSPGKVPFPLMHIDSKWKFKEMIQFRDDRREHGFCRFDRFRCFLWFIGFVRSRFGLWRGERQQLRLEADSRLGRWDLRRRCREYGGRCGNAGCGGRRLRLRGNAGQDKADAERRREHQSQKRLTLQSPFHIDCLLF